MQKKLVVLMGGLLLVAGCGTSQREVVSVGVTPEEGIMASTSSPEGGEKNMPAKNEEKDAALYEVDLEKSRIHWVGKKAVGSDQSGSIALKSGEVRAEDGEIKKGMFVVDMTSIVDDKKSTQLEEHLKNDDFFSVATFPTATFELTDFYSTDVRAIAPPTRYMAKGALTIKGKTQEISFPVEFTKNGEELRGVAEVVIDRTKWGIVYGSGSYMKNLGDKMIKDEIAFTITVVAREKK